MTTLPIVEAPAPWWLKGRGYIAALRFADDSTEQDRFLPTTLLGKRKPSRIAWLMFVDYAHSDVGPYHELLFIPGSFPFADGKNHLSISRIFVSSMASVVNGQRNWGIPKDLAEFEVRYGDKGLDTVRVSKDGEFMAELRFKSYPLWLPFLGALVPRALRTLGQHRDGKTFVYSPSASGIVQPARLIEARSNPRLFPDLSKARPLFTVAIRRFWMRFPLSRIFNQ